MTDRATKLMVIQVHDLRQQQSTTRLVGHKGRVNEVRFHPLEDHLLVSGSDDKSIRLWDWREKKTVRRLTGQGARVRSLTLTPDGEQIISGGSDGSIVRWNITAPQVVPERIPHAHVVSEPIFSRNNNLIVLDRWNELWDSSQSPLRVEPITLPPPRKQSNQDSSLKSIPSQQESTMKPSLPLFVVEVQRIKSLDDLPEEGSSTLIVALDDDNRLAFKYFPGRGTPLTFTEELYRDRPSQLAALKNRIEALGNRSSLSVSQQSQIREDYQEIVKDSPPSQRVWGASVYDSNTCEPVWNLSPLEHCLGFSPDDRFLLTLTSDEIFYREARTGQLDHSVEISTPIENPNFGRRNRVRAYALSPNGAQLSVAEYPPTLRVIATDTGKTIHTMNDGNLIEHHQYLHSGLHILFKGVKGGGIWTPGSDQSTYLYRTRAWFVRHLALSHDDQRVAGICSDNVIRIWSVPSGEIVHVIREIQDHIISISFSSDGRTLAVVRHGAPNIELWNTRTWRRLCELPYRSDLSAAVFSPDGRFLISSDQDGARLWRAPLLGEIDNAVP
jgi:WD40 repeat protein